MTLTKRSCLYLFFFYLIYLGKTALGINLLNGYSAPAILKMPLKVIGVTNYQPLDCDASKHKPYLVCKRRS